MGATGSITTIPRKSQNTLSNQVQLSIEEPPNLPETRCQLSFTEDEHAINTELNANASVNSKISTSYVQINNYYKQHVVEIGQQMTAMSVVTSSNDEAIRMPNYSTRMTQQSVNNQSRSNSKSPTFNACSFTRQFVNQ